MAAGSELDVPTETLVEAEARQREETQQARRNAEALLRVAAEDGAARGVRAFPPARARERHRQGRKEESWRCAWWQRRSARRGDHSASRAQLRAGARA
jgi:hypothetical protein